MFLRPLSLTTLILSALSPAVLAQENEQTTPTETLEIAPAAEPPASQIRWQALADLYYAWDLQRPHDRTRPYTTQPLRHNEFNLNLGLLEAEYHSENIRGRLGLQTGTYVQANSASEPALLQPVFAASAGVRLWENIWLDAGIFPSHIGFEGIISADNWNYSRSLIADYSPYYESGIKLSGSWGPVNASALVLNGWQNIQDNNSYKALGTQVSWQVFDQLLLNWSSFAGNEAPDDQAAQWRFFNDFYAVYNPLPQLDLALALDIGIQQRANGQGVANWFGTSLISRWRFTDHMSLAGRLEYYNDPEQVIVTTKSSNGFQVGGASLNFDWALNPALLWRTEARLLSSRDAIYPTAIKDQQSPLNTLFVTSLTLRFGGMSTDGEDKEDDTDKMKHGGGG